MTVDATQIVTVLGLGLITLVTRAFFLYPEREWPIPAWLREGLRYAPLAALVAIVAPEIVMQHGVLIDTFKEPRLYAAAAGVAWFYLRRGILGTIVVGLAVLLALRLGLGW